jgi:hypothetical protein
MKNLITCRTNANSVRGRALEIEKVMNEFEHLARSETQEGIEDSQQRADELKNQINEALGTNLGLNSLEEVGELIARCTLRHSPI